MGERRASRTFFNQTCKQSLANLRVNVSLISRLEFVMRYRTTVDEAEYCRKVADGLTGLEKPFMLKLAEAFDDLAERGVTSAGLHSLVG
jgi:hypothetical protein